MCAFFGGGAAARVRVLELAVVAGRPVGERGGGGGWRGWRGGILRRWCRGRGWQSVDLEWVEQLMAVRGVKDVRVRAIVEVCPPPRIEAMAFWVAVSKSVEGGFRSG